jgi:4-carboxymuconolactone decarboxylase
MIIEQILMKSIVSGLICVLIFSPAWAATQASEDVEPSGTNMPVLASISPQSSRPVVIAAPEHFTGVVHVAPLFGATATAHVSGASVTFEPGARTDWHSHPAGQTLVVTAGSGFIQFWGRPVQRISAGDVVWIPPSQKHWHGASRNEAMTHLAIQEQVKGSTLSWMEKVSQQQYGAAGGTQSPAPASRAQQLMGDIAPKLADLTDNLLYQDIWERPGLSKRDRSLVTVSALIALNRPDQLRSHLALALRNGVTADELSEVITHMAFYSGWPSAVSAITAAREVLAKPAGHTTESEPSIHATTVNAIGPDSAPLR